MGAAWALIVAVSALWLAIDRRPPEWDHANHLERAVLCARDLGRGDVKSVLERSSFYPPLVPCAAGLAEALVPSDVASAQAVVLGFLGLGMAATYLLGRRFAGGRGGVVAALAFGTAPFVVSQALRFQLDLPLAAMVAVALEVLLRTDGFARPAWSLAAGAVFALGMLTKPPFVVYVLPPLVLVLARARGGRALAHLAGFAAVGLVLALPWYALRLLGLAAQVGARSFKQAAEAGHPDLWSPAALAYYPSQFPAQFGALAVALFGVGLVVAARRRIWLPLAALLPLAVFVLIRNKNLRYTLPLLPAAAVVAAIGFAALPPRARRLAAVALITLGALQVSTVAFGVPPVAWISVAGVRLTLATPPLPDHWPQREILALITKDRRGSPATVSIVANHPYFSTSNFRYFAVRDGLPLRVVRAWDTEPLGVDYMVLKTGDVGPWWTADKPRRVAARVAEDAALARVFPLIGEFQLPDGSVALVRARRVPPVDARPDRLARAVVAALQARLPEVARDVEGLEIRLAYDRGILQGRIGRIEVVAAAATLGDFTRRGTSALRLRDLEVVLEDVLVNPWAALERGEFDPLDVGRLRLVRAAISAGDLRAFVRAQKRMGQASLAFEPGGVVVSVPQPGPDVSARVQLVPSTARPFSLLADHVTLGGVPVPGALVNLVIRHWDPSPRLASRVPFPVEIGPVTVTPDAMRISADAR